MKNALPASLLGLALVVAPSSSASLPASADRDPSASRAGDSRIAIFDRARRIDVNQINMWVTNVGTFAHDAATGDGGLIYPKGSGRVAMFAAGLWLGAQPTPPQIRLAIAATTSEFGPGAMVGGTFDLASRPQYKVYKVVRFTGNPEDTALVVRTPAELAADPQLDPLAHHSWSDYVNGAAPYGAPTTTYRLPLTHTADPMDSIDVVGPDVLGDQMLWTVYNDANTQLHLNPAGATLPLGVEVQQTTFAFSDSGPLGSTVFIRFKIRNEGSNVLHNMYAGVWSDPDVGWATDDLAGCDRTLAMGFAYNAFSPDLVYGASPPAVGIDVLATPYALGRPKPLGLQSFVAYPHAADPFDRTHIYRLLQGLQTDGSPMIDPTHGLVTRFSYSGDPLAATGWLDSDPADRRMLLSTGPLTMGPTTGADPTTTEELLIAVVVGQSTDHLTSIAALECNDRYVQQVFRGGFRRPFPPVEPVCRVVVNCPKPPAYWSAECAQASQLTPLQLATIAECVDSISTYFDWPQGTDASRFCDALSPPGSNLREQASQEFAVQLANFCAGGRGIVPADSQRVFLNPLSTVSCPRVEARNIAELVRSTSFTPALVSGSYLDQNAIHPVALAGVDWGGSGFSGGAGTADDFIFGSGLNPEAEPDSFASMELHFGQTQKAYRYLRLERQDGTHPPNGHTWLYGGHRDVPFTCQEVKSGEQLEVAFVERAICDAKGALLGPEFQVATFDSTWGPDASPSGGHEYLMVFRRPYRDTPRQEFQYDGILLFELPILYALWARLTEPSAVIDGGDGFRFEFGLDPGPGVDVQMVLLESRPLEDPAVQQAYRDILDCLGAINRGQGIGPTCDGPTPVPISPVSLSAEQVEIQRGSLSLAGFRPNPADGDLVVSFSLASRDRAALELFDLAGRRVREREVGALGPGSHVLALGGGPRLSAGIYVLRLSQGGRTVGRKAAILR